MQPLLRPLHGYEPHPGLSWAGLAGYHDGTDRWTSVRPCSVPQVTIEEPDDGSFRAALTKILEVMDGRRHIGQLQAMLSDPVYEATLTRLRVTPPTGLRYQLHSFHADRPRSDAVELCGRVETVRVGPPIRRAQVLVARMERHDEGWKCVFLRML